MNEAITFEFEPKGEGAEASLRVSDDVQSREARGEEAERLWERVKELADEVQGPRIFFDFSGR